MTTEMIGKRNALEARTRLDGRVQLVELSVFLFLIVPSLVLSFFAVGQGGVGFSLTAVATILRDLALVSLILYFLWRDRESVRAIGWEFRHAWREIALGVVLFVPLFFGASVLERALQAAGFSVPSMPQSSLLPTSTAEYLLAFLLVVIIALAEETIFRGYLMLRFQAILGSPLLAVLLSAFVFSLGHGYEGTAGVITVGTMGAVFALVYLWRGSLVAPVTMHLLQDLLAIIVLPLVTQR